MEPAACQNYFPFFEHKKTAGSRIGNRRLETQLSIADGLIIDGLLISLIEDVEHGFHFKGTGHVNTVATKNAMGGFAGDDDSGDFRTQINLSRHDRSDGLYEIPTRIDLKQITADASLQGITDKACLSMCGEDERPNGRRAIFDLH